MPVILANQKQRNILNECNNSCYNLVKDEDETMKNETQQFVLQEYKDLHAWKDVFAFYWSECYEIHKVYLNPFPAYLYSQIC